MKILLIGEYSNVHWTLAEGLRALGHDVTVASEGDDWKNYPRDIDLRREGLGSNSLLKRLKGTIRFIGKVASVWPQLRGYDVVQLINPVFLDFKAERLWPFYRFLRRHNGRIIMGAFGMDYYWVRGASDCQTFRYSDFNMGSELRQSADIDQWNAEWIHGPKGVLNQRIAEDADAIVTCLYEYDRCYRPVFPDKTCFIPLPINISKTTPTATLAQPQATSPLACFIGIQKKRSEYKGTDIMLRALERLLKDFGPERIVINKAENVPFAKYQTLMNTSHVLLDQLYSYTPAMNALLAMAKGLIVVGGGEEEQYEFIGESELRPIINVQPCEDDVYNQIAERLLSADADIHRLQEQSIEYVRRHHDHIKVARQYLKLYS